MPVRRPLCSASFHPSAGERTSRQQVPSPQDVRRLEARRSAPSEGGAPSLRGLPGRRRSRQDPRSRPVHEVVLCRPEAARSEGTPPSNWPPESGLGARAGKSFDAKVSPSRARANGLSLVELLLALALGLVVTLGLAQQYAGGRASASDLMDQADVQDSGRYALSFLRQSAAAAGHLGCNGHAVRLTNVLNGDWDDLFEFNLSRPVQGFDYQGDGASTALDDWSPSLAPLPRQAGGSTVNALSKGTGIRPERLVPGADVVVFRRLQQPVFALAAGLAPDGEPVIRKSPGGRLRAGDVALVSNCEQAAMFRITRIASAGAGQSVLRRAPGSGPYGNDGGRSLSESDRGYGGAIHGEGAQVAQVVTEIYFVGRGARGGEPGLWRRSGASRPVELVAGIVDLQVWAGVDGDRHDGFDGPNRYLPFSALADDSVIRSMSVAVTAASAGATRRLAQTLSLRNAR